MHEGQTRLVAAAWLGARSVAGSWMKKWTDAASLGDEVALMRSARSNPRAHQNTMVRSRSALGRIGRAERTAPVWA